MWSATNLFRAVRRPRPRPPLRPPVATPTFTPVPTCSGAPTPAPTPSPVCSGANNDLSLNFVDIGCPETPAVIQTQGAAPQLWRVANASGDDIVDLQVVYNGEPQPLQVVAFDGVPVNSQDGATSALPPEPVAATDILLGPGNRAEFLITPPAPGTDARLVTLPVNDGSQGANFPERTLAVIQDLSFCPPPSGVRTTVPTEIGPRVKPRFGGLATAPSSATRKIYFSEDFPTNPPNLFDFYVTVERRDAHALLLQRPAGDSHDPRRGRGVDHRKSQRRESRISHSSDSFSGRVVQQLSA